MGLVTGVLSHARTPVRLTLSVWEFGLSTAAEAARLGLELVDPGRSDEHDFEEYRAGAQPDGQANGGAPDVVVVPLDVEEAPAASAVADAPPSVPDELIPDHVDEEPVLVAETAEAGAEDGAGPELRVDPPWDGYDEMTAADIRDRLRAASAAEAAAVELYEASRKGRSSVLDAAAKAVRS